MLEVRSYDTLSDSTYILESLKKYPEDSGFQSQRWLVKMPVKRMIYNDIYGELLKSKGKRILDVAGGFCGLSRELIKNHDYTLVDIMLSDDHGRMHAISEAHGDFWVSRDWYDFKPEGKYDYIIANDIFPNVDKRLQMFIDKFQPYARVLIMTTVCNNKNLLFKLYRTYRFAYAFSTPMPWSCKKLEHVLRKYGDVTLPKVAPSLFKDGRMVYKCTFTN